MKSIIKKSLAIAGVGVMAAALAFAATTAAMASSHQPHFQGKTIQVVIRSTPGGGYDFHGRLLARHIGKHIPGNPRVIAVNRPGAGGLVATNYMYRQAARDGTEILIAARELAMSERLGETGVAYRTLEMPAIGSSASDNRVWLAGPDSVARNMAELAELDRDFIFAVSGLGAGSAQMVQLLEVAGYPVRIVTGYEGTGDQLLAMLRGEVDGMNSTYPAQRDIIQDENLTIVAKLGNHPDLAQYDDVREVLEGDFRTLANILAAPLVAGRPFFTAPGTPDDVVEILRQAFRDTMNDPAYIAELERAGEEVGYTSPEEMEELYRETLNAPEEIIQLFR